MGNVFDSLKINVGDEVIVQRTLSSGRVIGRRVSVKDKTATYVVRFNEFGKVVDRVYTEKQLFRKTPTSV